MARSLILLGANRRIDAPRESNSLTCEGPVMRVKYPDEQPAEVSRFNVSTSAEVTIQLAERDGRQFIVIKEHLPKDPTGDTHRTVEIPVALLPELKRAVAALEENVSDEPGSEAEAGRRPANFAHASEEEFARILDFYHIAWQYEPRTFAIEWDVDGNVISSFTPDFYLPDHDLYIELTTLKQALVTKKNRKLRLLRDLYPEVKVKILYASDYRKLIEKFAGRGTWQEQSQQQEHD